ncbi:hypothetical protein [Paragemmobacter ruber]|uniref:Uncharacterized protein n=1 Tax=Paragemmobacter ruber TaxID=1985673 RepID=A0ABW9YAZ7_9RHOB|nr:hypothetical protein [Rhodobacter ruber]NBE08930.1 hypothetical protein [Rhodobacter ruber]
MTELLSGEPTPKRLNAALRLLAKWRAQALEQVLVERSGNRVLAGPFKGMLYALPTSEGARNPRLIGCYEACLAPVIEEIVTESYDTVVDIGSAEGYYAVGLALRMPQARVIARDTDPKAQVACAELARANGVEARLEIGGAVVPSSIASLIRGRTVIICDIESGEGDLLDPVAAPDLARVDLLVEVHEGMRPGLLSLLSQRFAATHDIRLIERRIDDSGLPDWSHGLGDLDRLLLLWEWRSTPTPWLWMRRRMP